MVSFFYTYDVDVPIIFMLGQQMWLYVHHKSWSQEYTKNKKRRKGWGRIFKQCRFQQQRLELQMLDMKKSKGIEIILQNWRVATL